VEKFTFKGTSEDLNSLKGKISQRFFCISLIEDEGFCLDL